MDLSLEQLGQTIREACRTSGSLDPAAEPEVFAGYLASIFYSDVRNGGFGQLIYNFRGNYLSEVEDMLLSIGARRAHSYYTKCVRKCIDSSEAYTVFMARPYIAESTLKNELQLISIEYLQEGPSFLIEAGPKLAALYPRIEEWLRQCG